MTHYLEVFFRRYLDDEHLTNTSLAIVVDDVDGFVRLFPEGIAKWRFVRRQPESDNEVSELLRPAGHSRVFHR